jgi:predicted nucleotidyltransferase
MFRISQEQQKALDIMGRECRLRFVILHGSYATGKERPGSDLDIAIVGKEELSSDERMSIYTALDDIFGDSPERELDVKTLHHADPLFRYLVVRDGVLLYGDPTDYNEFKAYAFRDYMDSKDLRELEYAITRAKQQTLTQRYARSRPH